eukprot:scaffold6162_cov154-Cylindrotheca_fusiformis.AAC.4
MAVADTRHTYPQFLVTMERQQLSFEFRPSAIPMVMEAPRVHSAHGNWKEIECAGCSTAKGRPCGLPLIHLNLAS